MRSAELKYKKRRLGYERLLKKQTKAISRISNYRLLSFVSAAAFAIAAFTAGYPILFGALAAVSLILFIISCRQT